MSFVSQRGVKDALRFHAAFFALAIPVALYEQGRSLGLTILLLAALYNITLPLMCQWRGHRDGVRLWLNNHKHRDEETSANIGQRIASATMAALWRREAGAIGR